MIKRRKNLVYFIARIGGWDGIALQAEFWLKAFIKLGYNITLVVGEIEDGPGPINIFPYNKVKIIQNPSLSLAHQGKLYKTSFKRKYNRRKWLELFSSDKKEIKKQLKPLVSDADLVFLHNFSLKHLVPSAWAAFFELMLDFKDKKFISLGADSPYERSELMEDVHPDVLNILRKPRIWAHRSISSIKKSLSDYQQRGIHKLPGPDVLPNLYHIVLNSYQERVGHNIYGIPSTHLTTLPDIGDFSTKPEIPQFSHLEYENFFEFLEENQIVNYQRVVSKDTIFIVSPVRPVPRKKLREVVYISKLFEQYLKSRKLSKRVALVITHPNKDDKAYFKLLKRFASSLKLTIIYLGDHLVLRKDPERQGVYTYEQVMQMFAGLKSISIVGSAEGGWENAILESTAYQIPVCVNPHLPAYQDMNAFGYEYIPIPMIIFSDLKKTFSRIGFAKNFLQFPSIDSFYRNIHNAIFTSKSRQHDINHNYKIGYQKQSTARAADIISKVLRS